MTMPPSIKKRPNRIKRWLPIIMGSLCLIFLCASFLYWLLLWRTGLPSDEEIIAHFQAHRAEFEELVQRYRSFNIPRKDDSLPQSAYRWYEQPGTPELLKKAGVRAMISGIPIWRPEPYSTASKKNLMKCT